MIRLAGTSSIKGRSRIGPDDAGRLMTLEDFEQADEHPGYTYELIDGVLIVSPSPTPWHDRWVRFVRDHLIAYADAHPHRINCVSGDCEVAVAGRPGPTRPQPDIAAFKDYPDPPPDSWDSSCPLIVVEVISDRRARKDTTRNRQLYWMAGGIAEYWIIDPREDPQEPTLIALVRKTGAPKWEEHIIPFGKSHKSAALPRFTLNLKRPKRK